MSSPPINRSIPPPVPPPPMTSSSLAASSSSSAAAGPQHDSNNMNANNNNNNINNNNSPNRSASSGPAVQQRNNVNHIHSSNNINNNNNSAGSAVVVGKISNSVLQGTDPKECIVCNEVVHLLLFDPCGHQIACGECGRRMKKCLSCGTLIERRIDPSTGQEVTKDSTAAAAAATAANAQQSTTTTGGMAMNIGSNIMSFGKGQAQSLQQQQQQMMMMMQQQQQQSQQQQPSSVDRLRYLESKIMEIEETHCCSICMERRRNIAFLCGHSACSKCAETLKICHMCRKSIVKKINLY